MGPTEPGADRGCRGSSGDRLLAAPLHSRTSLDPARPRTIHRAPLSVVLRGHSATIPVSPISLSPLG